MYVTFWGVAWCCNGHVIGLAIERWQVELPAIAPSSNDSGQVVHTRSPHSSVIKQYNLIPA